MIKALRDPYCIDLGNGFTKRTIDGKKVKIEPSVYSKNLGGYQLGDLPTVNVLDRELHIGFDAIKSGQKVKHVLGETDRYFKKEFKELLYGFIAKDFQDESDIELPLLVLGLPVYHFEKVKDKLKEAYIDKKTVKYNGQSVTINIKDVMVIPQNVGTYGYLMNNKYNVSNSKTLIVDGGHGTLDLISMNGLQRESWHGEREGISKAYATIKTFLNGEFSGLSLSTHDVEVAIRSGLKVGNEKIDILKYDEVLKALDEHWDDVYNTINEMYTRLDQFANVVFTGGMALIHKERIQEALKDIGTNLIILDEGQNANVLGYYGFGKVKFDESNTAKTTQE